MILRPIPLYRALYKSPNRWVTQVIIKENEVSFSEVYGIQAVNYAPETPWTPVYRCLVCGISEVGALSQSKVCGNQLSSMFHVTALQCDPSIMIFPFTQSELSNKKELHLSYMSSAMLKEAIHIKEP